MTSGVKIRLAKPADSDAMFDVVEKTWLSTYPNKELSITKECLTEQIELNKQKRKKITQNKKSHTWVAVDGDTVIGICRAEILRGDKYLGSTYILSDYQRQGIGSEFIDRATKWFGNENGIITEVASYNKKAISFYSKNGFVKSSRIKKPKGTRLPNGSVIPIFEMTKMIEKKD
ncbi:GNAT family N-acetyltransferase [Patescibacteria group bacterium]|nr:GNAT family N-acetyltransferase [Patescibacteria group bacterium]